MSFRNRVIVFYVVLPLLLISFALPAIEMICSSNTHSEEARFKYLASVGFMTPLTSADPVYDVHNAGVAVIEYYNEYYRYYYDPPIEVYTWLQSSSTLLRFKQELGYRDRVQVTGHGSMTSLGPQVNLWYDKVLRSDYSSYWARSDGNCEVVLLAACYSMGTRDALDTRLARSIIDNTEVSVVIGFRGPAELFAAAYLVSYFWIYHTMGRTGYNVRGGYSPEASVDFAKASLQSLLNDVRFTLDILVTLAIGWALGPFELSLRAIFERILVSGVRISLEGFIFDLWTAEIRATMNGFTYVSDGSFVGSLTPVSNGGGGGSSGPIDTTH
ncbi:MAG: hypothetical protein QXQ81_07880 [Candidatus Thorarchaeota archaeon]